MLSQRPWQLLLPAALVLCVVSVAAQASTDSASTSAFQGLSTASAVPGYQPLYSNLTRQSISFFINLTAEDSPLVLCWYPISGNYCRLPRILFYVTIAAALLLRHYPWLYVGALAASLTYSGATAIHICLTIWNGHAYGDLDVIAGVAILSTSCIVMVPLLNWSSTIRNAGRPLQEEQSREEKHKRRRARLERREKRRAKCTAGQRLQEEPQELENRLDILDAASRTILLFWAFLVTIGFACAFAAVVNPTTSLPYVHYTLSAQSLATEIQCAPKSGLLDVTAGQNLGEDSWEEFVVTSEFLDANGCLDPCPGSPSYEGPALFRNVGDMAAISEANLFRVIAGQSDTTSQARELTFIFTYAFKLSWIIVYILCQGIWAACFGRSTPSEARTRLYGTLIRIGSHKVFAHAIAFIAYLWAVAITLIAVPLLIVNVTVIELYIHQLPQSESPNHIGAWSPYASTGLVLFAVFIGKYYEDIKTHISKLLSEMGKNFLWIGRSVTGRQSTTAESSVSVLRHGLRTVANTLFIIPKDFIADQTEDTVFGLRKEWGDFAEFWRQPDDAVTKLKARSEEWLKVQREKEQCKCPGDYECPLHPECVHHGPCAAEPSLLGTPPVVEMLHVDQNGNVHTTGVPDVENGVGGEHGRAFLTGQKGLAHAHTWSYTQS